jgi:hypothetical protein
MPLIAASEYNNVRQSIAQRVGNFGVWADHSIATSTTSSGYGRNFTSGLVVGGNTPGVSDTVTEQQYFDLWKDLQAAHVHIFGSVNATIDPTAFEQGVDPVDIQEITDFNTIGTAILGFNHATTDFSSTSFTTAGLLTTGAASTSSTRSTSWGGASDAVKIIRHEVSVNFSSHNALLYFLAAGGEIRFDASATGGTTGTAGTKDYNWAQMYTDMGTIRFGRIANTTWRSESVGGTGTGFSGANIADAKASKTLIFEKQGGGSIYNDNYTRIYAWTNGAFSSTTQLNFEIEFDDGDTGTSGIDPIDESVTASITSNLYTYTPDSDFSYNSITYDAITQSPPTGTVVSNL